MRSLVNRRKSRRLGRDTLIINSVRVSPSLHGATYEKQTKEDATKRNG